MAISGEHDLQAVLVLYTMDQPMACNFLSFVDLARCEPFDIVIGDAAWAVDNHCHENPDLKRQPFVFRAGFVGCLPMGQGKRREAFLCAERSADDLEHVVRYPWIRHRAIFFGNADETPDLLFGDDLPNSRDWTRRGPVPPRAPPAAQLLRRLLVALQRAGAGRTGRARASRAARAAPAAPAARAARLQAGGKQRRRARGARNRLGQGEPGVGDGLSALAASATTHIRRM